MLRLNTIKIGGLLYVVAVFQFFVFELVAETLYPGYSVASNYVSDLGATCVNPPSNLSCVVHQPTAAIFDATVSLMGLLLLAGACFVYRGTRRKPYLITPAVADMYISRCSCFQRLNVSLRTQPAVDVIASGSIPCRNTSLRISRGVPPMAIRTPISCVRWLTECAMTV